jgi:asparagine synthase (glutamine-hydrolysing)
MCGIYGIAALRPDVPVDPAAIAPMAAVTTHRGPDSEGLYRGEGILLGMRRLAIIDVVGGQQPLGNEDGTIQVVCNGEIYNYRELGQLLRGRGHRLATRSDCEVLAHLYEDWGDELVHHLNGMYAFALWDSRGRRLLIARDRLGIKPLYYAQDGPRLLFASEAKAILAALGHSRPLDTLALRDYLALGYVPAPRSMFVGIWKLMPGHRLICEAGRFRVERFWHPPQPTPPSWNDAQGAEAFRTVLERAVSAQMVSDVPLGAFLSGGIDSSAVVAFMARHSATPVKTYAIGFAHVSGAAVYNELAWARRVARHFRTDHHEILVRPDAARLLPHLLWHLDEPVADSAFVTTYLVAELARRDVAVILSGVGGDELFGGYRRYLGTAYDQWYARLPAWVRRHLAPAVARALPQDRASRLGDFGRQLARYVTTACDPPEVRYRAYVEVWGRAAQQLLREPVPDEPDAVDLAFREADDPDPVNRLSRVDLLTQLPDDLLALTDRMTMAVSLECRVPFLDNAMVDLALSMPGSLKVRGCRLKHLMKQALRGILPAEILRRPKRGFGAPVGAWFRDELAGLLHRVLNRETVDKRGLLRWEPVENVLTLHQTRRQDCTDHLLALLAFELWARVYLDGRPPDEVAAELAHDSRA